MKKPKKLKVFWNGEHLRDIYPHATRWEVFKYKVVRLAVRIFKLTVVGVTLAGFFVGFFYAGSIFRPRTIYADKEVPVDSTSAVMDRIAKCESHTSQYCTDALIKSGMCRSSEKGQVLVRANTNRTVDVGKYQINITYWGAEATRQNLNIFEEKDNEKMAYYIYKNFGTSDWSASQNCWKR